MDFIKSLFKNKLIHDDRKQPIWTIKYNDNNIYSIYAPKMELWQQLAYSIIIQTVFQCIFGYINYNLIVKQRARRNNNNNNNITIIYIIGWGIIIPFALVFPYYYLDYFNIQNAALKLSAANFPYVVIMRTIEAMYGTSPAIVEYTIMNYINYYSSLVHYKWDVKTNVRKKCTTQEKIWTLFILLFRFHMLSILLSIATHYNFQPFNSSIQLEKFDLTIDLLSLSHIGNAYIIALLVYLTLSFAFELTAFGEMVKGYATVSTFNNPLFQSTSPSDFWTNRWNQAIQNILKYGVYAPVRQVMSGQNAILITFICSGLLHEYAWTIMFYNSTFKPHWYKLTVFFIYNGILVLLERPLGPYMKRIFYKVPRPIVSTLIILSVIPVSHWYSGDWVVGGYFQDLSIGLWKIQKN